MQSDNMQTLRENSYLEGDNITYIEGLYEAYLVNPDSVSIEWREYFNGMAHDGGQHDQSLDAVREHFKALAAQKPVAGHVAPAATTNANVVKELAVLQLINAYRHHGHFLVAIDPLDLHKVGTVTALTLQEYGLSNADLKQTFQAGEVLGLTQATLADIIDTLKSYYCTNFGVEYKHMSTTDEIKWLQQQIEDVQKPFDNTQKQEILQRLVQADELESYLATKYVGQKRFSLEGGSSLIPMLNQAVQDAVAMDIDDCVIAMAHRGRLNVLTNIIGKPTQELFDEFEGKNVTEERTGDVKYHMGYSNDVKINGKTIHLSLAFNPSHLEIVSPVAAGAVRARQFRANDDKRQKSVAIMIHGDSAVAGQGVVMETLNMSQVRGFTVGGSVHIVINNQVGFTTSDTRDTRSAHYCSDVAKMLDIPIFHVNGDNPEQVCRVMSLAMAYRQKFQKDVMIDLVCYRRLGHNEADDPSITQPVMYSVIKKHKTPSALYAQQLIQEKVMTDSDFKKTQKDYMELLNQGKPTIETFTDEDTQQARAKWSAHLTAGLNETAQTKVSKKTLQQLAKALTKTPNDFNIHPQVAKLLKERDKMTAAEIPMNWGYAETLAYATLLAEGHHIRLCGQDSGRGTFAHRHAKLHDKQTDDVYIPLQHVAKDQAKFTVIDSVLSEEAVLAFEYGYAAADPDYLVLWEAQFGDFANGAQVVIDQFISSGEQKWNRLCGLVMLLPHGYEAMGPEHSSARLERFLQLCAQHNMQVCVPSTPAQMFHMLRRQIVRPARKPLVVMTPKSLLRHKLAVSTLADLSDGKFHLVIPEVDDINAANVERVVLCSGKVYYDLLEQRRKQALENVAIIRVEQLYPFPRTELEEELAKFDNAKQIVWCQEEPKNQGAWYQITHHLHACLKNGEKLTYAGRKPSAAPAVGYPKIHAAEQQQLVSDALGLSNQED